MVDLEFLTTETQRKAWNQRLVKTVPITHEAGAFTAASTCFSSVISVALWFN
jgi:hypothetical protein